MRRELATATEWAWAQGRLKNMEGVDAFCLELSWNLRSRFPLTRARAEGVIEIKRDVLKSLRVLTYGGRRPEDLAPERREALVAPRLLAR